VEYRRSADRSPGSASQLSRTGRRRCLGTERRALFGPGSASGRPEAGADRRAREHAERDALLDEIAALYEADYWRFVRVATAVTGNAESARDVVQDAFANLVRHRRRHRADASLGAWAWRVVVNTARSHLRAAAYADRAVQRAGLLERDLGSGRRADPDERALEALLRGLPERQRLVVFLRHYADLDYASIAEALSIRVGTVGATLNAAHATLRAALPPTS
jgi:RNA polymerase sigma factor (sigma-70 family)